MSNTPQSSETYSHLPEELLAKILDAVPRTVGKMNEMFDIQDEPINNGIKKLHENGKISKITSTEYSTSLIAVDGGVVLDKMSGSDLLLSVAVGVEGLSEDKKANWGPDRNQYYQWQSALPHDEANPRLAQGIMFLMELSVLAKAPHEIRIMDGTHFTPILKINSMLSAKEDNAGQEYIQGLRQFLKDTYEKIIPDIPDIIRGALHDEHIIALAKYSSSRDTIDAFLEDCGITIDDKTFFSLALDEDEYFNPLPVGQSQSEKEKIWNELHIICNLDIPEKNQLNDDLARAIEPLRTKSIDKKFKDSELYYTYYKPYQDGPAYRIEIKKKTAADKASFEKMLLSLKRQIVFPDIREPFPQYLVDLMAKSVAQGMGAIHEGIRLSPELKIDKGKFNLIFNYRTK